MTDAASLNIHATCVALDVGDAWRAVLLRGDSGAGKSDVAIRLIDQGARLVADDRTELTAHAGQVMARPPATLAGLLEARGLGVLRLPADRLLGSAPVALVVDLVGAGRDVERLPEPEVENVLGIDLPRIRLAAFDASTTAKIRLALRASRAH
ncbi:MAG TPA: HPr kinase/phosphatase C-terminal domain-containing protein [Vineibacter sp.]|nr:HPr kinase/phosphatase C-terminal domain-containing protein [Vineibacter sp.]